MEGSLCDLSSLFGHRVSRHSSAVVLFRRRLMQCLDFSNVAVTIRLRSADGERLVPLPSYSLPTVCCYARWYSLCMLFQLWNVNGVNLPHARYIQPEAHVWNELSRGPGFPCEVVKGPPYGARSCSHRQKD